MNALIVFSALVAASQAFVTPFGFAGPYSANIAALGPYSAYPGLTSYFGGYRAPLVKADIAEPIAAEAIPAALPLPASIHAPSSRFHAQDEFGNVNFGYANINSAHQQTGNAALGAVAGSWSYVDANGKLQTTRYVSDRFGGFRVASTNLPEAPVDTNKAPVFNLEAPVFDLEAPEQVENTPEVKAAIAEFQTAYSAALNRERRSTEEAAVPEIKPILASPFYSALSPYYNRNFFGAYSALPNYYNNYQIPYLNNFYGSPYFRSNLALPYAVPEVAAVAPVAEIAPQVIPAAAAAPALEATLLKIKNNPGFAESYQVLHH